MYTRLYNAYNQTREAFDRTSGSRVLNCTLPYYLRYKKHLQFLKININFTNGSLQIDKERVRSLTEVLKK